MLPDLFYPIVSAFLWAASVPIVAVGIRRIPEGMVLPGIFVGLLTSLSVGTLCLGLFAAPSLDGFEWNRYQALAGIFTFPVGTGLYYLCGYGFSGKMEVAAQFTKIKPLLSGFIAFVILGEALPSTIAFSLALVAAGIALLIFSETKRGIRVFPLFLGILTAASWAGGEAFVKIGFSRETTLADTFFSLLFATATAAVLLIPYVLVRREVLKIFSKLHGLLWRMD